jgi:hypothetical protein
MCNICGSTHPTLDMPDTNDVMEQKFYQDLNRIGARHFMANHPEFFPCEVNAVKMEGWLNEHHAIGSERNFEVAYRVLTEERELLPRPAEPRPQSEPESQRADKSDWVTYVFIPDGLTDADRKQYVDDHSLSDHTRKKKMEELRRAAIADRYARLRER